ISVQVPSGIAKQQGAAGSCEQWLPHSQELVSIHCNENSILPSTEWNICAESVSELQMADGLPWWYQLQGDNPTNLQTDLQNGYSSGMEMLCWVQREQL
ncbi:hypothetical protein scyTo_0021265, partial [Scyliorhinus torazame]|nr:hypothetical protein [Scyliorhinus torazame]